MASITSRLTRVVASTITRRTQPRRLFCTDSPSSATAGGTGSESPTGLRPETYFDHNELRQIKEIERNCEIFFRKKRSLAEQDKFFEKLYDKMQKSDDKYPGEVTKCLKGKYKGWRLYKPTLEAVPTSLPASRDEFEEEEEWKLYNDIFMKNRERWFKEGLFNIRFEGDVFFLDVKMNEACLELTDFERWGIPLDGFKVPDDFG